MKKCVVVAGLVAVCVFAFGTVSAWAEPVVVSGGAWSAAGVTAGADAISWNGDVAGGDWSESANWAAGHAPLAQETIYVTLVNCRFVQDDGDPDIYVKAGEAQGLILLCR